MSEQQNAREIIAIGERVRESAVDILNELRDRVAGASDAAYATREALRSRLYHQVSDRYELDEVRQAAHAYVQACEIHVQLMTERDRSELALAQLTMAICQLRDLIYEEDDAPSLDSLAGDIALVEFSTGEQFVNTVVELFPNI